MVIIYILFFGACCAALYFAGNWVVEGLSRIAKILHWKEFAVAFFIMSLAATLPNLFLAMMSVVNNVPELSLGDVMGGNVVDLTLAIALAVFFSKKGIDASGEIVQTSLLFTFLAAVLPLVLLMDGNLTRIDGTVLLIFFGSYLYWLLSKKERFHMMYSGNPVSISKNLGLLGKEAAKVAGGVLVLMGVAQSIISLAGSFSAEFDISLPLVGVLIVGFGNSLPEIYFAIAAAKSDKTMMILGDIMGAVIMPGTFVLGLVSVLSPFSVDGAEMFAAARYFLLIAAVFFYFAVKTGQKVTKKEGLILLAVYIAFLVTEIFIK